MSSPWPLPPPPPRDHLASLSNARLADAETSHLPPTPAVAEPPPPGRFEVIDDRGVFVREFPATGDPEQPIAVYIHGLAGSSTNFTALGTLLAGHCRGFALDLPGFGRSDPAPSGRYSMDDNRQMVLSLIDRIAGQRPVHLVGNSLGGVVATMVAAELGERARSLSLVSPAVPDLRLRGERGADPRLAVLLTPGTLPTAVRRLAAISPQDRADGMAALCYGDSSSLTAADLALAASDLAWRTSLPWTHVAVVQQLRALMRYYLTPGARSFAATAARVTAPALVVWGTRDRLVDAALAEPTAAAFARARLLILAGLGHVAQMEDPMTTARATVALWQDATPQWGAGREHSGAPREASQEPVATSWA